MTSSSTTATAVRPPPRPLNANVRAVYQFMFLRSVYSSLFPQTPLSYYVLLCTGSNTKVGLVQGIQGIVNLCTGFPFAVLGDRWRRESVLRLSAAVGCVAVALTLVVLLVVEGAAGSHSSLLFGCLCGVMAVWGVFMGSHSATVEAVFADSVESGRRSTLYSHKAAARTAGNAVGPILSVVVFLTMTDEWNVKNLTMVMVLGMAVAVLCMGTLFFRIKDKFTLGALSESLLLVPTDDDEDEEDDEEEDDDDLTAGTCRVRLA